MILYDQINEICAKITTALTVQNENTAENYRPVVLITSTVDLCL